MSAKGIKPVEHGKLANTVLDTSERRKRKASDDDDEQSVSPHHKRVLRDSSKHLDQADNQPVQSLPPATPAANSSRANNEAELKNEAERHENETIDAFLSRLPASTSNFKTHGPWLWIRNPSAPRSPSTSTHHHDFKTSAMRLLTDFKAFGTRTREAMPDKAASTITRKLTPARKELERDLRALAKETGVVSGKWMLFPPVEDIDNVWRAVCQAVDAGRLGPCAKVATNGGEGRSERDAHLRLVCVYTRDFSDERDVRRVLDELVKMDLVKLPVDDIGNGIYYKSDAYTYLNLGSGNEYKLKASLYSSKEMLRDVERVG